MSLPSLGIGKGKGELDIFSPTLPPYLPPSLPVRVTPSHDCII